MKQKINQLIETSKKIILDCCLENGAIVAANSTKPYYSEEAKNYFLCLAQRRRFYLSGG